MLEPREALRPGSGQGFAAGNIYDLGYRHYDGPRLGRREAVYALYLQSLRTAFGLGRGAGAKIIPFVLIAVAVVPAAIQLGIAAVAVESVEIVRFHDYYGFVQLILALFCGALCTELVGRDQRNHVLALYFSRTIERNDYALAKLAALASAMLLIAVSPQLLLFLGNSFAGDDSFEYLRSNLDQLLPIVGSGLLIALMLASLALAIAAYTPRRAYATGGTLAFFVISSVLANIIFHSFSGDGRGYALLFSVFDIGDGIVRWFFDARGHDTAVAEAGLPGALYVLAGIAFTALATFLLLRRYQRITV